MNADVIARLPGIFNGVIAQAFLHEGRGGAIGQKIIPGRHGLARDLELGALVRWQDGLPTYIFTLGTALALADAAVELVCTPTFMADIGQSDAVELNSDYLPPQIRFHDYSNYDIGAYCKAWPFRKQTMDGARRLLAFDLFDLGAKYIALHEQGHYVSGHLDLIKSSSDTFKEVGEGRESHIDFRILEMQADSFAAQLQNNRRIKINPTRGAINADEPLSSYVLRCVTVSMALVSALLEINDRSLEKTSMVRTHPSAGARLLNVLRYAMVARSSETQDNDSKVVTAEVDSQIFDDVIAVLEILGTEPLSEEDLTSFFNWKGTVDPNAPRAREAIDLLSGIPEVRSLLSEYAGDAVHRLIPAAAQTGPKLADLWENSVPLVHQFGHMTDGQFQLYLMEAVARSGDHIPWDQLGSPDFSMECIRRGEPFLRARHPGLFFRS